MPRVRSHSPSIRSHRGTKVVLPDIQPMRVPEDPVCIDLFRQNPAFPSLQLKYLVHVILPLDRPPAMGTAGPPLCGQRRRRHHIHSDSVQLTTHCHWPIFRLPLKLLSDEFITQFFGTMSAADYHSTRLNTGAARRSPLKKLPDP
jgi:hypothetical protein